MGKPDTGPIPARYIAVAILTVVLLLMLGDQWARAVLDGRGW